MSEVAKVDKERSALSEQLVYEFHRLVFSANNLIANISADLGMHGKDGDGLLLIWRSEIAGNPLSPSELADGLHITRAAASYLVDRLVNLGYVSRQTDPEDRRRAVLRIAESGDMLGHNFVGSVNEDLHGVFANRSNEEIKQFSEMLAEFIDQIDASHHTKSSPSDSPNPLKHQGNRPSSAK